jgi:gas vesicle protein
MEKSNYIGGIILGAAAALAIYKFYSMPEDERERLLKTIKNRTMELLDDAENTVEKIEHYVADIKGKSQEGWIDQLYTLKKMFRELYGNIQHELKAIA